MEFMSSLLRDHKTRIICTIGPASRDEDMLRKLIASGMSVARLNFSHGDLQTHARDIRAVREISRELNRNVAILADLPGPKVRVGEIKGGRATLRQGDRLVLTTRRVEGSSSLIPVLIEELPAFVEAGQRIFLNDGFIELKVEQKTSRDIICEVVTGGTLLSKKGMNLPDSHLTLEAVTDHDLELLGFGLEHGVDLFGLSFVSGPQDIEKARAFAVSKGKNPFLIAKIERGEAVENADAIIGAADGIMVARGDLGVEIPLEEVPIVQKQLILRANLASKPVITATQMLESMTDNPRPTRAEVADAANAIFDGTDAVMLSEETAVGRYPLEALEMLSRIAVNAEAKRSAVISGTVVPDTIMYAVELSDGSVEDALSLDVIRATASLGVRSVVVPTLSGNTARRISRFKGDAWIFALCRDEGVLKSLSLSYGVVALPLNHATSDEEMILGLRDKGFISPREKIILVRSDRGGPLGVSDTLRIITPAP